MNIPIQHDIQYNDTASHWKVSIIDGLKAREQGVAGYLQLYQSYAKLLSLYSTSRQRIIQLEQEIHTSRQYSSSMSSPAYNNPTNIIGGGGGNAGQANVKALEDKISRLQEDLTQSYKLQSETSKSHIRLKEQSEHDERALIKKEEELQIKIKAYNQLQSQIEEDKKQSASRIKSMEQTIELLRGEVTSSRAQWKGYENTIVQLRNENDQLTTQVIAMKQFQVEQLNEKNMIEEKLVQQQKLALELQSQRERANRASIDEGKSIAPAELDLSDNNAIIDHVAWQNNFNVVIPKSRKRSFSPHTGLITSLRYNHAGTLLASSGIDGCIRVYDARSGGQRAQLRATKDSVMCVSWSHNDAYLLGSGNDQYARIWSIKNSKLLHNLIGHQSKIYACLFTLDNELAITGSHDRTIRLWDMQKDAVCRKAVLCHSSCNYLSISHNNNMLASAHLDAHIRLWSVRTGEMMHDLEDLHAQQATSVEFSKDGMYIVTNSRENLIKITDIRTFKVVHTLEGTEKTPYRNGMNWNRAIFSPDSKYIISGSSGGELFIWNTDDAKINTILPAAPVSEGIYGAMPPPSSSGPRLSVTTGAPTSVPDTCISCIDWNRNGRQISTCDQAGYIHQWEADL